MDTSYLLQQSISVSELNQTIKSVFFDNSFFNNLYVYGEISGYSVRGGHAYFTLKDKESQIAATIWSVARFGLNIKEGDSVILLGGVDYWTKGGKLSFIAKNIIPIGKGLLFLEFEKLKLKLEEEGLFAEEHKKPIPKYPKKILVITSKDGAVIRDINSTIRKYNPVIDIVVKDVRVQGESAAREIIKAIEACDKLNYDVIIIARGGGSLEDLAPFYDENLARAVYNMNTPVISAVGHETDFSICDFVADYRAETPTAAAELVGYDWYSLVDEVKENALKVKTLVEKQFALKLNKLKLLGTKLGKSAENFYSKKINKVLLLDERIKNRIEALVVNKETRLQQACVSLDALSPLKTFARGYFSVTKENGEQVTYVKNLSEGEKINVRGQDGTFKATVDKINKK